MYTTADFFTSSEARETLINLARSVFDKMIALPKDIRPDEKKRTGIQILIREIGTSNIIFESIYSPSEAAQFLAAEKAVRSEVLGHLTSQKSKDPARMRFDGSITMSPCQGSIAGYQVSIAGLKGHEDVFISIVVMARLLGISIEKVADDLQLFGANLPDCCFDHDFYHWKTV